MLPSAVPGSRLPGCVLRLFLQARRAVPVVFPHGKRLCPSCCRTLVDAALEGRVKIPITIAVGDSDLTIRPDYVRHLLTDDEFDRFKRVHEVGARGDPAACLAHAPRTSAHASASENGRRLRSESTGQDLSGSICPALAAGCLLGGSQGPDA